MANISTPEDDPGDKDEDDDQHTDETTAALLDEIGDQFADKARQHSPIIIVRDGGDVQIDVTVEKTNSRKSFLPEAAFKDVTPLNFKWFLGVVIILLLALALKYGHLIISLLS